mmetsp:Transcript_55864/g.155762  ORF Transcript_55864/g.155762 Transcript_55864/m.155762 type:complete len:200 (-) Transcript_55864:1217-1816(-)
MRFAFRPRRRRAAATPQQGWTHAALPRQTPRQSPLQGPSPLRRWRRWRRRAAAWPEAVKGGCAATPTCPRRAMVATTAARCFLLYGGGVLSRPYLPRMRVMLGMLFLLRASQVGPERTPAWRARRFRSRARSVGHVAAPRPSRVRMRSRSSAARLEKRRWRHHALMPTPGDLVRRSSRRRRRRLRWGMAPRTRASFVWS